MAILYKIIMLIAAGFGILLFKKIQGTFFKVVLGVQFIAILLTVLNLDFTTNFIGIVLLYSSSLVIGLHGIFADGRTDANRRVIATITLPLFLIGLFKVMHWPYASYLMLYQIIPFLVYIIFVLFKRHKYNNELGVLTIIAAETLIQFITILTYSSI